MSTVETHNEHGVSGGWNGRGKLADLVAELERQKESRIDFVVDGRHIALDPFVEAVNGKGSDIESHGGLRLKSNGIEASEFITAPLRFKDSALGQIGQRVEPNVPVRFMRELVDSRPHIAARMLNSMLHEDGKRHLVRCLDGNVRAMLSNRYRVMDNYDLAFAALDVARDSNAEVFECSLSDTHMRLKFVTREVWDVVDGVRQNDKGTWYAGGLGNQEFLGRVAAKSRGELPGGPGTVHPLVTIGNSETGHGGLSVRIGIMLGVCFNLATVEDVAVKAHIGGEMAEGVYTEETREADSRAMFLKIRDSIRAAFNADGFKRVIAECKGAAAQPAAPRFAVEQIAKSHELSDARRDSILDYFLADYAPTRFGLAQAIGRVAQDVSGDEAAELETLAGSIIKAKNLRLTPQDSLVTA